MDDGDIRGRLRRGTLLPAAPGVYDVGHRSDAPGQREAVALAAAGPGAGAGAQLAGPSATGWIGMTERVAGPVHLIVGPARGQDPHPVSRGTSASCFPAIAATSVACRASPRRARSWICPATSCARRCSG